MATMNVSEIGIGSAKVTGAIYVAATSVSLPTSASAAITSFTLLGFTSDAGVTISEESSNETLRAWEGRKEVRNARTEYTESVSFMPIQCNADVAKLIWGSDKVEVDASGNMHIKHHGGNLESVHIVIETESDSIIHRYCGEFQLVERGELVLDGTQVEGRQLTFNAIADSNGITMHEYTTAVTGATGETS